MVAFVKALEIESEEQCQDTESGENNHGNGIVVVDEEAFRGFLPELFPFVQLGHLALYQRIVGVDRIKNVADEKWNQAQADILYPENLSVGTTEYFLFNNFWN